MRTPPADEIGADDLAALQELIDRSARAASPALADSVGAAERQMRAEELLEFWRETGLVAMTTVGPSGQPHIAPVHAELRGPRLVLVVYENTLRRRDLTHNPRVAFTTWGDGAAVILYGRAREITDSLRDARPARSGTPRKVVTIEVALTRVHAMRSPTAAAAGEPGRG